MARRFCRLFFAGTAGADEAGLIARSWQRSPFATIRPPSPSGRSGAVVDAKYAAEKATQGGGSREHLYQIMSYCVVLGLKSGHIVYARGHDQPTTYTIQTSGIKITCHSVDLDQPPERLIGDMHTIADRIDREPW